MIDSQKHIFLLKICLNQANIFHFQKRKGTMLSLRETDFFDFVTVMPNYSLKVPGVFFNYAII